MLQKQGFYIHHQKGSYIVLKSEFNLTLRVTVPIYNKDLKKKTFLSIIKQTGLEIEDLIKK